MSPKKKTVPTKPSFEDVIEDCTPAMRRLGKGRYAMAISGSIGKGASDEHSDLDFRLYCDETLSPECWQKEWGAFVKKMEDWKKRGITIDGCWVRKVSDMDAELSKWLAGTGRPEDLVWAIWGYYLPTDLYNQKSIEDPSGILAGWKDRLRTYPAALKRAVFDKHLGSLRYWRGDYHYASKVRRGDEVFLACLTARLAHDVMQVVYALNETYFPGDGNNFKFVPAFRLLPRDFTQRVKSVLYPGISDDMFRRQRDALFDLIVEVESLVEQAGFAAGKGG
jgi:hypothetical protein